MTAINQNTDTFLNKLSQIDLDSATGNAATKAKEELETLFTDLGTLNEGDAGAAKIQRQIATLQEKIAKLEEDAQDILETIEDKNSDVQKKSGELASTASSLTGATGKLQSKTEEAARMAARDAILSYKQGRGDATFEECYNQAFAKRLGTLQASQSEIQALYDLYEQQKGGISSISKDIEGALDEVSGLQAQLDNVNATISLLTRTKNIMEQSTIADAYKNIDTDANVPIYSGKKADVANAILAQYTSRYDTNVAATTSTASSEKQTEVMNEYTALKNGATYKSGDIYSTSSNPECANLAKLIAGGMIEDLQATGMNTDQIMTFISSNWNVGIKKSDGNWSIPYGHSTDAKTAYGVLNALVTTKATNKTADDVNQNQVAELMEAMNPTDGSKDILTTMYEAGFTYKEAMYTLVKAFPDAGITYDLNSQSTRNYGIVTDTDSTNGTYQKISEEILNYWNVGGTAEKKGDTSTTGTTKRTDPITFQNGDTTYTFLNSAKMEDGTFDYTNGDTNDLLGSEKGIEELLAYDVNGDGKISGDELDNVLLMVNNQAESVGEDGSDDVDGYKTGANYKGEGAYTNAVDFKVSYSSATDLGITEIDLSGLTKGTGSGEDVASSTKDYDGYQEAYDDINGSAVINTFNVKMNGKTIEAKETLNTESNLETFYGQIANDANASTANIKATDKEFNDAYDDLPESDVINNVKDRLEEIQEANKATDDYIYGDVTVTSDQINELTGMAFLVGMRDEGRKAAEKNLGDSNKAADASEEAVEDYWEEHILHTKDDDEE